MFSLSPICKIFRNSLHQLLIGLLFCQLITVSHFAHSAPVSCSSLGVVSGQNQYTLSGYISISEPCEMDITGSSIIIDSTTTIENTASATTIQITAPSNTLTNSGYINGFSGPTILNQVSSTSLFNGGVISTTSGSSAIYNDLNGQISITNYLSGLIAGNTHAIYSDGGLTLYNYGEVLSIAGGMQAAIDVSSSSIFNFGSSSQITSNGYGISVRGNSDVQNYGGAIGLAYSGTTSYAGLAASEVGVLVEGSGNFIYNRLSPNFPYDQGRIYGRLQGVLITGGNNNGVINYGSITSDFNAIEISAAYINTGTEIQNYGTIEGVNGPGLKLSGTQTLVTNFSTGFISSIYGHAVEDSLQQASVITINNSGTIQGFGGNAINLNGPGITTINNSATTDAYTNTGKIIADTFSAVTIGLSAGTTYINNSGLIASNNQAIETYGGNNTINNYGIITSPSTGLYLSSTGSDTVNNYGQIGDMTGVFQNSPFTNQAINIRASNVTINNYIAGSIEGSSNGILIGDFITNTAINNQGLIYGSDVAIGMGSASPGGSNSIQNSGTILSNGTDVTDPQNIIQIGVGVALAGQNNYVENSGQVTGARYGIVVQGDDNTIVNESSGTIIGDVAGINVSPFAPMVGTTQITNYGVIQGVDSIQSNTGYSVSNLVVSNSGILNGNLGFTNTSNTRLEIFGQQAQIISSGPITGGVNSVFNIGSITYGSANFTLKNDVTSFDQMNILPGSSLIVGPKQYMNTSQTDITTLNFYNSGRLIISPGHLVNISGEYHQTGALEIGIASTASKGQLNIIGNANFGNSTIRIAPGSTIMPETTYASVLNVTGTITGALVAEPSYEQGNYAYTYDLMAQAGNPNSFDLVLGTGTIIRRTYEISQGATFEANSQSNLDYAYINNYGTLSIPSNVNLPMSGAYTQTGVLQIGIQSPTQYGRLSINGTGNLNGGSLKIADGSQITPGQYAGIITSTNGLSGSLAGSSAKAAHRRYDYSTILSSDGNSLDLIIAQPSYSKTLLQGNANLGLLNIANSSDRLISQRYLSKDDSNKSNNTKNPVVWVTPFGEKEKLNSDESISAGYRMDRSGLALGAEEYTSESLLVGFALSAGQGRLKGMDAGTRDQATINNHEFIAYSKYEINPKFDLRFSHAQGWAKTSGSRYDQNMEVAAFSNYRSRYHHSRIELALQDQPAKPLKVTPIVGLAYTEAKADAYTDSSMLTVRQDKLNALAGVMRANIEYLINEDKLGIQVGVKRHLSADRPQQQLVAADGHLFTGFGVQPKATTMLVGASYKKQLKKDIELDLAYDLSQSSNLRSHNAQAKFRALF